MIRPAAFAAIAWLAINPAFFAVAHAAPPTVTPSPGYDARLQEQRKATSTSASTLDAPSSPANPPPPVRRHHAKPTHPR